MGYLNFIQKKRYQVNLITFLHTHSLKMHVSELSQRFQSRRVNEVYAPFKLTQRSSGSAAKLSKGKAKKHLYRGYYSDISW